jgi:molybdopterin synthase catalytic subunit
MIEITERLISPELVVNKVKTDSSGCVLTYIGLIRGYSRDKGVLSVEYEDVEGTAEVELQQIASETRQKWQLIRPSFQAAKTPAPFSSHQTPLHSS